MAIYADKALSHGDRHVVTDGGRDAEVYVVSGKPEAYSDVLKGDIHRYHVSTRAPTPTLYHRSAIPARVDEEGVLHINVASTTANHTWG
eukprot:5101905-Amphidinium_carterae.1